MQLAGNSWLKDRYKLEQFELSHVSYIGSSYKKETDEFENVEQWYPKHYQPNDDAISHIEFALKYDDLSLDFLYFVFQQISKNEIELHIKSKPNGKYERKIGFLYEFLTKIELEIPDVKIGNYIDLLEKEKYIIGNIVKNKRWKINDNLLGDKNYCPIIRKTKTLDIVLNINYQSKIEEITKEFSKEVFYRAINYLYRKETKSSYKIEKEVPTQDRVNRFIHVLRMAGTKSINQTLTENNLVKLQNEIIEERFADKGFRDFQNYVGETTINYREKLHYACPPPSIINSIMNGYLNSAIKSENIESIIKAGILSFGFVFAHPFNDGNGRLHRFLIHDVLARDKIVSEGVIIPISARMLTDLRAYDIALENYSMPLLKRLKYEMSDDFKLTILNPNEVESYFRFPDLTYQCIYLAKTLEQSIEIDLHLELEFLFKYDDIKKEIQQIVDMPDRLIDLAIKFMHQNNGIISKRKRQDLIMLNDLEIEQIQNKFRDIFSSSFKDNNFDAIADDENDEVETIN